VLAVEQRTAGCPSSRVQRQRIPIVLPPVILDVHEVTGEVRNGLFVGNNPINRVDPYGLTWALFSGEAWGQLLHDTFIGDSSGPAQDPNSQGALSANAGYGFHPLYDADGNALGNPASAVGGAVVGGVVDAASMLTGGGEAKCGIKATEKGLQHVLERHIVNGIPEFAGKSKFTTGTDLMKLIEQGAQTPGLLQANGRLARTFDAGSLIGIDRTTGQSTSIVTIITDSAGNLVTMFPGKP
jgi:hypothetical protein